MSCSAVFGENPICHIPVSHVNASLSELAKLSADVYQRHAPPSYHQCKNRVVNGAFRPSSRPAVFLCLASDLEQILIASPVVPPACAILSR